MFDVFLINFGYVCGSYKTLEQAIEKGRTTGFEFTIYKNKKMVWSIIPSEEQFCNKNIRYMRIH